MAGDEKGSGLLSVFGNVRPGETRDCLLQFVNLFLLLVAYYILKTVREPLILATGGAELKTYASAAQAAVLLAYVPAYGWVASRLSSRRLVVTVLVFFIVCIQLFVAGGVAGVHYLGFVFFVWVGIFSLTAIAQFWSIANDTYEKSEGDRLFPIIAIGATAGAPLGAALAERLFAAGVSTWAMMEIASALLVVHLVLYQTVRKRRAGRDSGAAAAGGGENGFALVLRSPYLRLIALLLVLLNVVNTTGEYILANIVTDHADVLAAQTAGFDKNAYIGAFYGNYFFWVNIASVTLQALAVSRVVKRFGIAGVVLALPIVAVGVYGVVAASAGFALVRWMKTAENCADYSFMNTAKQMLWLPTTPEERYKGKQAVDTFFVRFGDLIAAAVVYAGTEILTLSSGGFAVVNLVVDGVAIAVALMLLREAGRLSSLRAT